MLGMFLLGLIIGCIFEYFADINMIKSKISIAKDLEDFKRLINIK